MGYGSDFSATNDITPDWKFLEGTRNEVIAVQQAVYRRLSTPRGGNPFDPSYGYDLRALVASTMRPSDVAVAVAAECRKDERILDAKTKITVVDSKRWNVQINITLVNGDSFTLTLDVSQVTVQLLNVGA